MKHRTLRCAAETLVLLLIAAMTVFLAAGLHQHAPDGALSTLSTGWYQLTDGVRREVTLPAALETGPGQTITLYNDTLTDSDGGKVLSARGVEYGIEIRAGETLLYRYEDNAFPKNAQMKGRLWADTELPYGIGGQTLSLTFTELPGRMCRIDAPVLGSMPAVTGRHIQSSLFSVGMILVMLVLAVLALLIFLYMSFYGIRERRFLDTAVFLLLCSLWCLTDSGLYQLLLLRLRREGPGREHSQRHAQAEQHAEQSCFHRISSLSSAADVRSVLLFLRRTQTMVSAAPAAKAAMPMTAYRPAPRRSSTEPKPCAARARPGVCASLHSVPMPVNNSRLHTESAPFSRPSRRRRY